MPIIRGRYFEQKFPLVTITISNNIAQYDPFDDLPGPIAERKIKLNALIDTGATASLFDDSVLEEMSLPDQGLKDVLLAGSDLPSQFPAYTCSLSFHEDPKNEGPMHEWIDWPAMIAMRLSSRHYKAIIGMDIIEKGTLRLERGNAIRFEF